jgi:hypothetical protein
VGSESYVNLFINSYFRLVFAYGEKIDDDTVEYGEAKKTSPKTGDVEDGSPYIFRSYDHWGSMNGDLVQNPGPAHNIPIWEVCRATTAAPTYFDSIEISNRRFTDGAFGETNNPTAEIFREVLDMNGNRPGDIKLILSIGTGDSKIKRYQTGWKKYARFAVGAKRKACDPNPPHKEMQRTSNDWKVPYYRLNVPKELGLYKVKLDDYAALGKIERITESYCETIVEQIGQIAHILVKHRKERSMSAWWPLVSTGSQYRCTVKHCRRTQQLLKMEEELRRHIRRHSTEELNSQSLEHYLKQGTVDL